MPISVPAVLVLGAGASVHAGFPSGIGLRDAILTEGRQIFDPVYAAGGGNEQDWNLFKAALRQSGQRSVDRFLELRPDFATIGKLAISAALLLKEFEFRDRLFAPHKTWYDRLLGLVDNRDRSAPLDGNLAIVTFNYDRSLEYYLHIATKTSYSMSDDEARARLAPLQIVHVHGTLGQLEWERGDALVPYGRVGVEEVRRAASTIKIVHEADPRSPEFARAQQFLEQSSRVVFLGFGFDKTNLTRLGCPRVLESKVVAASCRDLFDEECAFLDSQVLGPGRAVEWAEKEDDCDASLRRFSRLF